MDAICGHVAASSPRGVWRLRKPVSPGTPGAIGALGTSEQGPNAAPSGNAAVAKKRETVNPDRGDETDDEQIGQPKSGRQVCHRPVAPCPRAGFRSAFQAGGWPFKRVGLVRLAVVKDAKIFSASRPIAMTQP